MLQPISFKGLHHPPGFPKELNTLGDHLLAQRVSLGLRQKDVADRIGVSAFTILNWEKNRTIPRFRDMPAILKFLGYNPLPAPQTLSEQLLSYRRINGLSQRDMANSLGINPCTLSTLERGKRTNRGIKKKVKVFLDLV